MHPAVQGIISQSLTRPPTASARTTTTMARRALSLLLLLLLLLCLAAVTAFIVPPAAQPRRSGSGRLHVLDPASLPDPATVDAAVAGGGANGANQVVDALRAYVFSPSGFGATGLLALGIRMYTYFTAQSMMARLVTLFAKEGTTVEMSWGNSLRNLWYYENKMDKLIVPAGEPNEGRFSTIQEVCAKLQAAQKTSYDVIPYRETLEGLSLADGSVDTIVSTYMWCKQKDPYKAFEKAMRLLKDGGAFVFVEPVVGEGPVTGLRRYLGQIHRATGAFGDPSLDIKGIVERWANGVGKQEGFTVDVEVEERGFLLDPHMWGVIYKKDMRDVDEKLMAPARRQKLPGAKGFQKKEK